MRVQNLIRSVPQINSMELLGQQLETYVNNQIANDPRLKEGATQRLHEEKTLLSSDIEVLFTIVPNLELLLEDSELPDDSSFGCRDGFGSLQLKTLFSLCRLVQILRGESRVVLFLDDLQWSDGPTVTLLGSLAGVATQEPVCFCTGSYRENEVNDEALQIFFQNQHHRTISVGDLSVDAVNNMVSDVLERQPQDTLSLAELIHPKTGGNIFSAREFLSLLAELELIYYSWDSYKWEWKLQDIQGDTQISSNVVELVGTKVQNLSESFQWVLKIASCLGGRFSSMCLIGYESS
jgi:hypothetical protein